MLNIESNMYTTNNVTIDTINYIDNVNSTFNVVATSTTIYNHDNNETTEFNSLTIFSNDTHNYYPLYSNSKKSFYHALTDAIELFDVFDDVLIAFMHDMNAYDDDIMFNFSI